MWQAQTRTESPSVVKTTIAAIAGPLSFAAVIKLWQHNEAFREFFIGLLAGAPYTACLWETPPVTRPGMEKIFEFVLVDCPQLARVTAEPGAFEAHFRNTKDDAVTFPNLGHDATLIAPCPADDSADYSHLAAFSRSAPAAQQHDLWRRVGMAMQQQISNRPVWLSTSGLGVYWLHVRLDSHPKYYSYRPYKVAACAPAD
jgi:hypothetical protein